MRANWRTERHPSGSFRMGISAVEAFISNGVSEYQSTSASVVDIFCISLSSYVAYDR